MKSAWLAFVSKLSLFFQSLDLTALAVSIAKLEGFVPGWILSPIINWLGHKLEKKIDQKVGDIADTYVSDGTLDIKKDENIKKVQDTKSDEELDQAFRDSLK